MAGHSKWANIQHKKARVDAQRGKIFTKLIKEITVAARLGGGDPASNPRLRLAMDKAWDANMPKDNVQRAIDKGTGNLEGVEYIELRYEGYGIGGAALMVDCMTDNKTRTVADVRHAFNKNGGNLGTDGCVAFNFVHQGYLVFTGVDEDALMEAALEAGAEDVSHHCPRRWGGSQSQARSSRLQIGRRRRYHARTERNRLERRRCRQNAETHRRARSLGRRAKRLHLRRSGA